MKNILIYASMIYIVVLISLFTNVHSMTSFLASPVEIKLYIFEIFIKNIIENNSIFEPSNNIKETISNITLVDKEFNNFKPNLIKFAKKYVQNYFATEYANWSQEKKDAKFENIFINIGKNSSEELEIEAAKLIIAGANPNLKIDYNRSLSKPL